MRPARPGYRAYAGLLLSGLLWLVPVQAANWVGGRVVSVTDGDTAVVETETREVLRVRFYGVDAPETANRDWPAQPFSTEAKRFMQGMLDGHTVRVRLTGERTHKREVGEIFVEGRSASAALVEAGLGWWNRKFAPRDQQLRRLEAAARKGRLGLWSEPDPVPPWRHRARYRSRPRH